MELKTKSINIISFLFILLLAFPVPRTVADLVAHWKFDEQSGSGVAADQTGSFDGTLFGGADFVSGGICLNALSLDGAPGSFVDIGNQFPGFETGDFTLTAWIQTTSNTFEVIYSKHESGTFNGYFLAINGTGFYGEPNKAWLYGSNPPGGEATSTTDVNDGLWHFLVGVYRQGGMQEIYVDGIPVEAQLPSTGINPNGAPLLIGGFNQAGSPIGSFTGLIDDVQVYDHALSDDEIDYLFKNPGRSLEDQNGGSGAFCGFDPAVFYGAGDANDVAAGDFDGDGDLDIAVANFNSDDVSILMNNGDGTFADDLRYSAGDRPLSVEVGDLDGDSDLDLVIGNGLSADCVSVLLNNGNGTFASPAAYSVGDGPRATVGDVDSDDDLDIISANAGSDDVSVLLNNGDGTFSAQTLYGVGEAPLQVAVGDIDDDGNLDLAVANRTSFDVSILVNDGDGTFSPQILYDVGEVQTGAGPDSIAVSDVDNDNDVDLIVAHANISILLNNGNGTFSPEVVYESISGDDVAVGDLDGDNDVDIAVNGFRSGMSLLLNNGDGTYETNVATYIAEFGAGLAIGDFDGDCDSDIIAGNLVTDDIAVFLNDCNSCIFAGPDSYEAEGGGTATFKELIDLNDDNFPDFAIANFFADSITIRLNDGAGGFLPQVSYDVGDGPQRIAHGDLNGDNMVDLALTNNFSDNVSILINNGSGTFLPQVNYDTGDAPGRISIGDLNGDNALDLVVSNGASNSISILLNNGSGIFLPQVNQSVGVLPTEIAIVDLDSDGDLDLIVINLTSDNVSVLLNNGDGSFSPQITYDVGEAPRVLITADIDSDNDFDMAILNGASDDVSVLLNSGNGTFSPETRYEAQVADTSVRSMALGDLDNDADLDLTISLDSDSDSPADFSVFRNYGDGTFSPSEPYTIPGMLGGEDFALGDLDGDDDLDIVITSLFETAVVVNLGEATFQPYYSLPTFGTSSVILDDLDRDNDLDLFLAIDVPNNPSDELSVFLNNCPTSPILVGDVNLDGLVNLLDVEPFINLLSNGTFQAEADCNGDGVVNLLDVEPFIAILSGG